ncbi:MAG: threonylcarbamoyl-AMP synthase [Candidatus Omnitrophica bacterium]|nr:threonylcarbamoyl-AMP synthase [Candidatus Omnitrophota bacterium]
MKPRVLKIDPRKIDLSLIKEAARVITGRGLVAFPTETVYGLGANALDPDAVTGIFEAKRRPLDDPLIVHISRMEEVHELSGEIPARAEKLLGRFWPGPLTVVLRKSEKVPDIVTTGLETVAIRMPSNPIARKLIEVAAVPIAAPSANLFGRPSPTSASHVIEDLRGRIDLVLDGGKTDIGVESTVVEFMEDEVLLLRPGGIDLEDIRDVLGDTEVTVGAGDEESTPGKYPQHYSPRAAVRVVEPGSRQLDRALEALSRARSGGKRVGVMALAEHAGDFGPFDVKVLGPRDEPRVCASRLFHILREFDAEKVDVIVAEGISEKGLGRAVMNRLRKAAGPDLSR